MTGQVLIQIMKQLRLIVLIKNVLLTVLSSVFALAFLHMITWN